MQTIQKEVVFTFIIKNLQQYKTLKNISLSKCLVCKGKVCLGNKTGYVEFQIFLTS